MELGNNKAKDFGNKEIKPPQTEVLKAKEMAEKKWKELGRFGSIFGPTVEAANAFNQSGQKVGNQVNVINNKVTINGKEVSTEEAQKLGIYTGDHEDSIRSVKIAGNFEGVINTGDNFKMDIPNPKFDTNDAMESAPFGSKEYNNIHGNIKSSNTIQGTVNGNVINNDQKQPKPDRETYIASKDQIEYVKNQDQITISDNYIAEQTPDPWEGSYKTGNETQLQVPQQERQSTVYNLSREQLAYVNSQDKFVQKQEPKTYNSMDDVFEQMVRDWEVAYGVEPIPKASENFDNIDEINAVIDRNWKIKFANYQARQPKAEPEAKEVLRKRDKIKNVLKNVGNRIKDKLQEWYDKIDIKIDDDIDFEEMNNANFYVEKNESNYSNENLDEAFEILEAEDLDDEIEHEIEELKTDPVVVAKGRKNLEDILVSSKPSAWKEDMVPNPNASWRTPKTEQELSPEVIAGRAKLDNLKVSGKPNEQKIESKPNESIETSNEEIENLDNIEMDEFTEVQMLKFESINKEVEIETAIKEIQNEILDLTEEDTIDSNIKKIKTLNTFIKSYKDKKEIVKKDIKELIETKGLIYDSRSFEVNNIKGKLFAKVKNDKITPNEQYSVIIDDTGKLKFTGDGGKNYAVKDIKDKILNQKLEENSTKLKEKLAKL